MEVNDSSFETNNKKLKDSQKAKLLNLKKNKKSLFKKEYQGIFPSWSL